MQLCVCFNLFKSVEHLTKKTNFFLLVSFSLCRFPDLDMILQNAAPSCPDPTYFYSDHKHLLSSSTSENFGYSYEHQNRSNPITKIVLFITQALCFMLILSYKAATTLSYGDKSVGHFQPF